MVAAARKPGEPGRACGRTPAWDRQVARRTAAGGPDRQTHRQRKEADRERGLGATAHLGGAPESGASGLRSRKRGEAGEQGTDRLWCRVGAGGGYLAALPHPLSPFRQWRV